MRAIKKLAVTLLLTSLFCSVALADDARDITGEVSITADGINISRLTDGNTATFSGKEKVVITVSASESIGGIYLRYRENPIGGKVGDEPIPDGLLATYTDLSERAVSEVTVSFDSAKICELAVYSKGDLPRDVQVWRTDSPDTDLMLFATHSDDDQLFFAGLLPYYARRDDLRVRVAYFVSHSDAPNRLHELLSGLWECGVEYYPEIGIFPDAYSESLHGAKQNLAYSGISYDSVMAYQRSILEKYRPQIVVLHDIDGEYGHGQHILNTQSLIDTLDTAKAGDFAPKKVYIHLYGENKITLPIDEPLPEFGGLTAFQVSQNAFRHHKSQHWTWFYGWLYGKGRAITDSSQITDYTPRLYGLYRTLVGEDTKGNDMLESITPYSELERLEAERIEAERLEAERQEAERLEAERQEAERLERERIEKERLEAEKAAAEKKAEARRRGILTAAASLLSAVAVLFGLRGLVRKQKRRQK